MPGCTSASKDGSKKEVGLERPRKSSHSKFAVAIFVAAVLVLLFSGSCNSDEQSPEVVSDEVKKEQSEKDRSASNTAPEEKPQAGNGITSVAMRFVDKDGLPLKGVQVKVIPALCPPFSSSEDGRAQTEVWVNPAQKKARISIEAKLAGYPTYRRGIDVFKGRKNDLGDITLGITGSISGSIVDASGNPVSNAIVILMDSVLYKEELDKARIQGLDGTNMRWDSKFKIETHSKADGTFLFPDVERSGSMRIWAGADRMCFSWSETLEVRPGDEVSDVKLVLAPLPPDRTISGIVLSSGGKIAPKAPITVSFSSEYRAGLATIESDDAGRFCYRVEEIAPHTFEARDPIDKFDSVKVEDVKPGTTDLVLKLMPPAKTMRLTVWETEGEALEAYTVSTLLEAGGIKTKWPDRKDIPSDFLWTTHLDKSFTKDDFDSSGQVVMPVPNQKFKIRVWAQEYAEKDIGPFDAEATPDSIRVILKRLPGVKGRVVFGDDPIEDVRISLHPRVESGYIMTVGEFRCLYDYSPMERATTAADGTFCAWLPESGIFFLRAEKEGFAPFDLGPLEIDHLVGLKDLEVRLCRGGSIEGRVLVSDDEDAGGIIVVASRGDGYFRTTESSLDGAYRLDMLTPGPWQIGTVNDPDDLMESMEEPASFSRFGSRHRSDSAIPWDCNVSDGQTTHYDLDLTKERK